MNAIDTNIWIYCHDRRVPKKQAIARSVVEEARPLALIWQVGCEFIAASRKLVDSGFSEQEAWDALDDMKSMADLIVLPDVTVWTEARRLYATHSLSFWDALLLAACVRAGLEALYSEDISDGFEVNGVKVINPFAGWDS